MHLPMKACCLAGLRGRRGRHAASRGTRGETGSSRARSASPEMKSPARLVGGRGLGRGARRTFRICLRSCRGRPDGRQQPMRWRGSTKRRQSIFPNIAASPIPVLLPFDTAAYLKDKAAAKARRRSTANISAASPRRMFSSFPGPPATTLRSRCSRRTFRQPSVRQGRRCADFRLVGHLRTRCALHRRKAVRSPNWKANFPASAA